MKYVLKHSKYGYFLPGNSGSCWYNDTDFVNDITHAATYINKSGAVEMMLILLNARESMNVLTDPAQYTIVPVEIVINTGEAVTGLSCIEFLQKRIDDLDTLSDIEFDKVPEVKYRWYNKVKKQLKDIKVLNRK